MLAELIAHLARAADVEEVATILARDAKWLIPNHRCTLLLLEGSGLPQDTWRVFPGGAVGAAGRRGALSGPIGLALRRGLSVVLADAPDELSASTAEDPSPFVAGARSIMVLPLAAGGEPFGTINFSATEPGLYARAAVADRTLLQANVAAVVQNARQAAQLRQLSELKSTLMAGVAHDYKNPLALIAGCAELLLLRDPDSALRHRMLSVIRKEALRLNTLAMNGEQVGITRVLMNLIGNAVKYSPAGGQVRISVRASADRREVSVAVADQGIGIAPEALPTLFQPFQRSVAAVQSGIEGTGLGLAICLGIVEAHRGRLWAESAGLHRGSTFYLALPTVAGEPGAQR